MNQLQASILTPAFFPNLAPSVGTEGYNVVLDLQLGTFSSSSFVDSIEWLYDCGYDVSTMVLEYIKNISHHTVTMRDLCGRFEIELHNGDNLIWKFQSCHIGFKDNLLVLIVAARASNEDK